MPTKFPFILTLDNVDIDTFNQAFVDSYGSQKGYPRRTPNPEAPDDREQDTIETPGAFTVRCVTEHCNEVFTGWQNRKDQAAAQLASQTALAGVGITVAPPASLEEIQEVLGGGQ